MSPKKTPSLTLTNAAVKEELEYLYLRHLLIDNLIRSIEVYALLDHRARRKAKKAA